MITLRTVPFVFRCRRRGSRLKSSAPPDISIRGFAIRARGDRACAPNSGNRLRRRSVSVGQSAIRTAAKKTRQCRSCGRRFKDGRAAAARSSCRVYLRRVTRPLGIAELQPEEAGDRATPGRRRRRRRHRSGHRYSIQPRTERRIAPPDDDLTSRVCVCVRYHELSSNTERRLQCGRPLLRGRLRRGNILHRK